MPFFEYWCENCDREFTKRRPFSESDEPLTCAFCEQPAERIMSLPVILDASPVKATETWDRWYSGKEVATGMTREQTMALARKYYRDQKHHTGMQPAKTISTPSNPVASPYSGAV